jgi:Domain of unknown function (DUF1924)
MSRPTSNRALALGLGAALVAGAALGSPESLLATYQRAGAGPFDASAGARAWAAEHNPPGAAEPRSCATCHGKDLTKPGRHATTGKTIEPMAPSVNPQRLADPVKSERWFGRNCRWTLGRECTAQEKGDFIRLLQSS